MSNSPATSNPSAGQGAERPAFQLSVYDSKYDGRKTATGTVYRHWKGLTCASNNPKHKGKVLRITWKGKTLDLKVTDTGGDKRLGYSRIDISGKAMLFFVPSWNRKDKGAPLLKNAEVTVL